MATRSKGARKFPPEAPQQHQQGNLGNALTSYDDSQDATPLTINIPGKPNGDEGADMNTDDRERSLTLGSEFDIGWVMGKDGRGMSISGLLTPLGDPVSEGMAAHQMANATATQHLPENTSTFPKSAKIPVNASSNNANSMSARARGDSTASVSQFLNGLYPQQVISHTPPTQMGTSYENSHFGKRMRAGVSLSCNSGTD